MMRGGRAGDTQGQATNDLLAQLVESLMASADNPPTQVEGAPDSFIEDLDRVPKKALKSSDSCPICSNPFLDGNMAPPLQVY